MAILQPSLTVIARIKKGKQMIIFIALLNYETRIRTLKQWFIKVIICFPFLIL